MKSPKPDLSLLKKLITDVEGGQLEISKLRLQYAEVTCVLELRFERSSPANLHKEPGR